MDMSLLIKHVKTAKVMLSIHNSCSLSSMSHFTHLTLATSSECFNCNIDECLLEPILNINSIINLDVVLGGQETMINTCWPYTQALMCLCTTYNNYN